MQKEIDISHIAPPKVNDDQTIKLIGDIFGNEYIKMKPNELLWYEYYAELWNYYKRAMKGKKHYWDSDVQKKPYIKDMYEKIPEMWFEKNHLSKELDQATDISRVNFALEQRRYDVLSFLAQDKIYPSYQALENAVMNSDPHVYEYAIKFVSEDEIMNLIILSLEHGLFDIHPPLDVKPFIDIKKRLYYKILNEGSIDALNNIHQLLRFYKFGVTEDRDTLIQHFISTIVDRQVVQIMINNEAFTMFLLDKHLITENHMLLLIENGQYEIIDFLIRNDEKFVLFLIKYNNVDLIDAIISEGYYNIILTLFKYGYKFNEKEANMSLYYGQEDILDFFAKNKIYPDVKGANFAAAYNRIEDLKWLLNLGIYPDINGANSAAGEGNILILECLAQKGIFPDIRGANKAATNGKIQSLNWLSKRNIFPNVIGANQAAFYGHENVLVWLSDYSIYPTKEGIARAIFSGSWNMGIQNFAVANNIIPDKQLLEEISIQYPNRRKIDISKIYN